MAQIKKIVVRDAILAAADTLFREQGYHATTIAAIARRAGVSSANIYVYFSSKLEILFALYDPWLRARLERLEREAMRIEDPARRLRAVFAALWRDIPAEEDGFSNNLMQALSTASAKDRYSRDLLLWAEAKVSTLIASCLPSGRGAVVQGGGMAHVAFMAFDGFAMNQKFHGPSERIEGIIDIMVSLLLDGSAPRPARGSRATAKAESD